MYIDAHVVPKVTMQAAATEAKVGGAAETAYLPARARKSANVVSANMVSILLTPCGGEVLHVCLKRYRAKRPV